MVVPRQPILPSLNWPRHGAASHARQKFANAPNEVVSIGRVTARPHTQEYYEPDPSSGLSQLAASRRGLTPMEVKLLELGDSLNWPRHGAASHKEDFAMWWNANRLNWPRHGAASHGKLRQGAELQAARLNWPRHGAASHIKELKAEDPTGMSQLAASRRGLTPVTKG